MITQTNPEQQAAPGKGYRVFRVIRTIFVYVLATAIIIAALLFAASATPNKSLFEFRYYTVLTPSMEPTYKEGDMVFVKIENADNIAVGDVITFNPSADGDAYLTHRVTEKIDNYEGSGVTCFKTKGDVNDSDDTFLIDEDRVIGTVKFSIPVFGYIVRFVQLRWYFIVPLIILIIVFFKLIGVYLAPRKKAKEDLVRFSPHRLQVFWFMLLKTQLILGIWSRRLLLRLVLSVIIPKQTLQKELLLVQINLPLTV